VKVGDEEYHLFRDSEYERNTSRKHRTPTDKLHRILAKINE
jgi:hypothetical protein